MINDKTVLVVVPARGGSKGVPLKNLRQVGGLSLVERVGRVVQSLDFVDRAVVSTDHEEIAQAAQRSGLQAPFYRPPELSGDQIGDWDVLSHALDEMESRDDCRYEIIIMLQPTSPLRTPDQVSDTVVKLVEAGCDAVWTVSPTDFKYHPLKQLTINDRGILDYYDPAGTEIIARQQLDTVYHRNGVAYAITRDCLKEQGSIMGKNAGAIVIEEEVVNIDSEDDFSRAESLVADL